MSSEKIEIRRRDSTTSTEHVGTDPAVTPTVQTRYAVYFTVPKVIRVLLITLLCLLAPSIVATYLKWVLKYKTAMGIVPLFDFDGEFNLPALFSVALIVFNSLALYMVSKHTAIIPKDRKYWRILSFVFLYLSFDELVSIHEQFGLALHRFAPTILPLSDSRFWIMPVSGLLVFFALYFFRFFWSLPKTVMLNFFIAGLVFVGGAFFVELAGEFYMWYHPQPDFGYGLLANLEEACEMLGMILFLRALLQHLLVLSKQEGFTLYFLVGRKI